jgi:hypothetical protein
MWTLKDTKHHWFLKCELGCCTSNLKLVIHDWYVFMSKIIFMLNFIHAFWFHCFQAIYVSKPYICFVFKNLSTYDLYMYYYWPIYQIHRLSFFWWFLNFLETAKSVFIRHIQPLAWTYLTSRTYLTPGPDMFGSQVLWYLRGSHNP